MIYQYHLSTMYYVKKIKNENVQEITQVYLVTLYININMVIVLANEMLTYWDN